MVVSDLFSVAGVLKILETVFIFIALLLHRHGDNGEYIFFSTTGLKLESNDPNIDAENLGNSTLVTFMVINIALILTYILDGMENIHTTILEPLWNFLGACMFAGSGAVAIITWQGAQEVDTSSGMTETEFSRNVSAALAMAGICIFVGALYLVDTVVAFVNRRRGEYYED